MVLLNILLIMMIIGAIIAVEIRNLLSSIIALGIVGFAVTLAFLILQAPDLAIVQIVVEVLTVVFMISAILKTSQYDTTQRRIGIREFLGIASLGVFFFIFYLAIKEMPKFGYPVMKVADGYVLNGLRETGAANIVSAIILDYRAYDTLGEATVLFTAVMGVIAILRIRGRKRSE